LHPEGEVATARGAGAAGVPWTLSTGSNTPLDDIARAATAPLWFQLYAQTDRERTRDLVQLAEGVGCQTLVLTVDTANQGIRNRQTRAQFALPDGIVAPYMGELTAAGGALPITNNRRGAVVTWDDVEWLRSISRVPVLLKGILDGDEAREGVERGADGIIVSNHGARNLDTVPATIDALPSVVARVDGRAPVLVDGGIRRGTDIIKALALGATSVLIGRPYCFGLAVGGAAGVARIVDILQTELELAMQLMGLRTLADIDANALWDGRQG
ncbi:MAG: alpha-hydroxy acid oxidase, partial [Gemmatimonas sp.]